MSFITYENFESSTIKTLFYSYESQQLIVQYKNGSQYRYNNVSKLDWDNLCTAKSKGSFINESIKSKPYQKMILTD